MSTETEKMCRVQVSMYEKLLTQIDKERGSISRSSYIRAILESAKLSGNKILKLAKKEQEKADANRFKGKWKNAK